MTKNKGNRPAHQPLEAGLISRNAEVTLRSYEVGALPIINSILRRMRLSEILRETLPTDDSRIQLATHRGLVLLMQKILVSREPIYGVGQWAAGYAPDLLDLFHHEVELLNDDRAGRCIGPPPRCAGCRDHHEGRAACHRRIPGPTERIA